MFDFWDLVGSIGSMTGGIHYFLSSLMERSSTLKRVTAELCIGKVLSNAVSMHDDSLCL
jgi:hypothetical protein